VPLVNRRRWKRCDCHLWADRRPVSECAGRSLAARVLLDHYAAGRVDVRSAGSEPSDQLNLSVVSILQERGLDPTQEFPKTLTDETARMADVIVTMGCGDSCPFYPGKRFSIESSTTRPASRSQGSVRSSTRSTVESKCCSPR